MIGKPYSLSASDGERAGVRWFFFRSNRKSAIRNRKLKKGAGREFAELLYAVILRQHDFTGVTVENIRKRNSCPPSSHWGEGRGEVRHSESD